VLVADGTTLRVRLQGWGTGRQSQYSTFDHNLRLKEPARSLTFLFFKQKVVLKKWKFDFESFSLSLIMLYLKTYKISPDNWKKTWKQKT